MLDRRRSLRRRTLLGCRLSARRLGPIGEGTVRDLSEAGARVTLPANALLPHDFDVVVSDGAPRRARLVWLRDGAAGLALSPEAAAVVALADDVEPSRPSPTRSPPTPSPYEARVAAIVARSTGQRP